MKPTLKSSIDQDLEMAAKLQALSDAIRPRGNALWDGARLLALATMNEKDDRRLAKELRGHAADALSGTRAAVKAYAKKLAVDLAKQSIRMPEEVFWEVFISGL